MSLDFEAWGDFRWLFCFGSPSLRLQLYILLFVAILIIIIICLDAVAVQNNYINCTFYRIVILLLALSLYHLQISCTFSASTLYSKTKNKSGF